MVMIPECFPYSEDRRNKQEPRDLQKYTALLLSQHPTPTITKSKIAKGSDFCSTQNNKTKHVIRPTNLDGLIITAGYHTKLLIWVGECYIIYSTNMSINLNQQVQISTET